MRGALSSHLPGALEAAPQPAPGRRLRPRLARRAADFWLNLLFWNARRNPGFVRQVKPLFLWGAWRFSPMLRTGTLANARRLLGENSTPVEREALARTVIGNFYDFVCDVGRSAAMSRQQLLGRIEAVEGLERYDAARREGKGAIIVTAHMGSFEIGVAGLMEYERQVHVLFRRDERGLFEQTRSALRRRLGVNEAYVEDGLPVWVRLREALERNEVVLIQGDRVLPGQKGERLPFLGGTVLLPTGPVKLAMASGALMIPVFTVRTAQGNVRLFIEDPIRVPPGGAEAAMQQLAKAIERYVRQFPEQWLMVHPAWCEDVGAL